MRNTGGCALIAASGVLLVGAIAINSTALFLMATALGVMILTCRLQAWLSVRGLRLVRDCPACVYVGNTVTVRIGVTSDYGFKRPLVTVNDMLPEEMEAKNVSPSLPIAPSHAEQVYTQYQFEPGRRGKYRINRAYVQGSDALGLVRMRRKYSTNDCELVVFPVPIPFEVRLPHSAGWGFSETDYGVSRGQGIEPRGVREYNEGDSQRYIHWRSSARTGQLMVKEFETGSLAKAYVFVQTDLRRQSRPSQVETLDRMCGNAAHLCDALLRHGAEVHLPSQLNDFGVCGVSQRHVLLKALAELPMVGHKSLSDELAMASHSMSPGSTVYLFMAQVDVDIDREVAKLADRGIKTIAILYSRMDEGFVVRLQRSGATVQFEVRQ